MTKREKHNEMDFNLLRTNNRDLDSYGFLECEICGANFTPSNMVYVFRVWKDGFANHEGTSCNSCASAKVSTIRQHFLRQAEKLKLKARVNSNIRDFLHEACEQCPESAVLLRSRVEEFNLYRQGDDVEADMLKSYAQVEHVVNYRGVEDETEYKPEVKYLGFVYLLGSPEGYCKIGRTISLHSRLATISLQMPFKVELLHSIEVSDPVKAERFLHDRFKDCRANGEWFLLSVEQINWIKAQTSLEGMY